MANDKSLIFEAILHSGQYTAGANRIKKQNEALQKSFDKLKPNKKIFDDMSKGAKKLGTDVKSVAKDIQTLNKAAQQLNGRRILSLNQRLLSQRINANQQIVGARAGGQIAVSNVRSANQMNVASSKFGQYQQLNNQRFQNQMAVLMQKQQNMLLYNKLNNSPQGLLGMVKFAGRIFAAVRAVEAIIQVFQAAGQAIIGFIQTISEAGMRYEKHQLSLNAIDPNANTNKVFSNLLQLAKQPGIGIDAGFEGYNKLRFGGASDAFTMRALSAFAKANATVGGGKDQFNRTIYAVSETMNKPFAQAQELFRQLEFLPIRKILKEKFGVSTTQELKEKNIRSDEVILALVESFEKLKVKTDSFYNLIDNFGDTIDIVKGKMGGAFNQTISPMMENLAGQLEKFVNSDFFEEIGKILGETINVFSEFIQAPIWGDVSGFTSSGVGIFGQVTSKVGLTKDNQLTPMESNIIELVTRLLYAVDQFIIMTGFVIKAFEVISKIIDPLNLSGIGNKAIEVHSMDEIRSRLTKAFLNKKEADKLIIDQNAKPPSIIAEVENSLSDLTKSTDRNTRAIEKANNFADRIIGGGSVGAKGISSVELAGIKNGRLKKAIQNLAYAIQDSVDEGSLSGMNYMGA